MAEQRAELKISAGCEVFKVVPSISKVQPRFFSNSQKLQNEQNENDMNEDETEKAEEEVNELAMPIIDPQTSIRYMKSKAYNMTYGDTPVWKPYRRNFKGMNPPAKTRKTCIRKGILSTGNPCPICRDKYLVVHSENVDLLKQFISEHSGEVISYQKTGVCQKQHKNLLVAIEEAKDKGLIEKNIPFRKYDYTLYYPQLKKELKRQ